MSKVEGLKMVEVAVDLLIYLSKTDSGIGPREISRLYDISSTAAQRLVTSLERKHCLKFDDDSKKYKLGYGLIRFVHGVVGKYDLITIARPYMENLRNQTGETICLNIMIDKKRVTISQIESRHEVRWTAEIGKSYPLYIGASGKVILANQEQTLIDELIEEQMHEYTAEKKAELYDDLHKIKCQDFFVSYGERVPDGIGIAVPIKLWDMVASISIYAPITRVNEEKINYYVKELIGVAKKVEKPY
jgi:IclR family KDG regulon transcriptional repressor